MRTGIRLGIDVGKARIGVAKSDLHGMLATPVETIPRDLAGSTDLARVLDLVSEHGVFEIIVGLPLNLRGTHTLSTDDAVEFARKLSAHTVPVRLIDERMSTVSAWGQLHASGRKTKGSRGMIDQAAAVVILQHALDSERAQRTPPGTLVDDALPPTGKS